MLICNNFSELFSEIRAKKGWNQSQLADFLGIGQSYVSAIERGERVPSNKIQHKLSLLIKECGIRIEEVEPNQALESIIKYENPEISLEDYIKLREDLALWKGKAEAFSSSYDKLLDKLGESIISIEDFFKGGGVKRIGEQLDVHQVRRSEKC